MKKIYKQKKIYQKNYFSYLGYLFASANKSDPKINPIDFKKLDG